MFKKLTKSLKKAFTITELVIVIAVIAILAAVLIPTFSNVISSANQSAALSTCKNALTDLEGTKANAGETSEDLYGTGFSSNGYYYVFFMGQLYYLGEIDTSSAEVEIDDTKEVPYLGYNLYGNTGTTLTKSTGTQDKLSSALVVDSNDVTIKKDGYDSADKTTYVTYTSADKVTGDEAVATTMVVVYELVVNSTNYAGMFRIEVGSDPTYQTEGATYSIEGTIMSYKNLFGYTAA